MNAPASCTWLRSEGVLAEERGESSAIAAHLAGCPACQRLHAEINELRASLGRLPATEPASGWQRAVWARIEARRKPRLLRWAVVLAPVAAAAALALFVIGRGHGPAADEPLALAMHFEKGATAMRAQGDVAPGDILAVNASGLHAPVAELRVYRDDAGLVFQCAGDAAGTTNDKGKDGKASCARQGTHLQARFVVPAIGRYRVLVITAPAALPATAGSFDADVGALSALSGVGLQQAEAFQVW